MKSILILGAGGAAAYNFIQCLRMEPELDRHAIIGTDLNRHHLAASNADFLVHLPDDKDMTEAVEKVIKTYDVSFIYAAPDVMVQRLSLRRDWAGVWQDVKTFLPDHRTIGICHDKVMTNKLLENADVPVPKSFRLTSLESKKHNGSMTFSESDQMNFVMAKERTGKVWLRATKGAGSKAALPVTYRRQAEHWVNYWVEEKGFWPTDFMFCEYLPGPEYAWQSLWHYGELVTSIARERLEYFFGHIMPSGQSSTPSIAKIVHDGKVNAVGMRAVKAVDKMPHGVYGVDMKRNVDGVPCVTEINVGRFYTTSNFYAQAGCNMPAVYTRLGMISDMAEKHDIICDLPPYNAVKIDQHWIRNIDREPLLWMK